MFQKSPYFAVASWTTFLLLLAVYFPWRTRRRLRQACSKTTNKRLLMTNSQGGRSAYRSVTLWRLQFKPAWPRQCRIFVNYYALSPTISNSYLFLFFFLLFIRTRLLSPGSREWCSLTPSPGARSTEHRSSATSVGGRVEA